MQDRHEGGDAPSGRIALVVTLVLAVLAAAVGAGFWAYAPAPVGTGPLAAELRDRGRIAVVGDDDLLRLDADGAELIPARDVEGLEAALAGTDEDRLEAVLRQSGIAGILADGRGPSGGRETLAARLRAFDRFEVLQGAALTPVAALYLRRHEMRIASEHGAALARAARQIVGGAAPPRMRAFPEPLRRTRNVEVLVMLRHGGRPRLWRSARSGSIARALVTAASVARERWAEREPAMGGPIDKVLPSLTVEVYLLEEDGTLGDRSPAFVERVFTPEHGVGFEDRRSWHYLLPEATRQRGEGSAVRAYAALFEDAGLPPDSLTERNVRLYRLVARRVGISARSATAESVVPGSSFGSGLLDVPGLDVPALDTF